MIDELDLAFDEQDEGEKGRHRRVATGAAARRRRQVGRRARWTIVRAVHRLRAAGRLGGGAFFGFDRVQ